MSDGSANPNFGGNFGFAWYQSDLHTNHHGEGDATTKLGPLCTDPESNNDATFDCNP